ncbi:MAG: hypothetical protein OXC46_01765 [Thaumarchaeota archaeon]|nr:hypothetical protein [Nitrososphaerota archaeon]
MTISDAERNRHEIKKLKEEKSELEKKIPSMIEDAVRKLKDDLKRDGWSQASDI